MKHGEEERKKTRREKGKEEEKKRKKRKRKKTKRIGPFDLLTKSKLKLKSIFCFGHPPVKPKAQKSYPNWAPKLLVAPNSTIQSPIQFGLRKI